MYNIEYSGYVYDLTTSNHHFQAGVGSMIVHNTDSIFIKFPTKELVESIRMGIEAGKQISLLSRKPYKIAYEKTFYPFILFCRKRYVGMMYEEDANAKPKRKSMGIVLKRRDNAPIVKDVFGGALDMLLTEKDVRKAQQFVNEKLKDVLENRVPLEKFIVSKSLRDDYKNPSQIAHRVLADRMESRDAGTAPKVGDRLQFVYVAENKDKAKQGDRIEEIGYVRKNKLTPDAEFYIRNQIQNPVAQLFALCIDNLDGYVAPRNPSYSTIYENLLEKHNGDEEDATIALLDKKEKQLENIMFMGSPHLLKLLRKNTRGPMDAFVTKK
jgi:DNA polymerase elongation subunit (family B)